MTTLFAIAITLLPSPSAPLLPIQPTVTPAVTISIPAPLEELEYAKPPIPNPSINGSGYDRGQCVYGVALWARVPDDLGNANQWAVRARRKGFYVSHEPIVGAVGVSTSGRYGHVALVVDIKGQQVRVKEENWRGVGVVSYRWTDVKAFNYIYF